MLAQCTAVQYSLDISSEVARFVVKAWQGAVLVTHPGEVDPGEGGDGGRQGPHQPVHLLGGPVRPACTAQLSTGYR